MWPGAVSFNWAGWRDEVGNRAWVDAESAPGRSYKCIEKSDLKYPLIHGQGRQVSEWPPSRIFLQLPMQRWECLCPLLVAVAEVLGSTPKPQYVSPSAQGAQGPQSTSVLYLCICWGCLLSPHTSLVPRLGYWEHWPSLEAWETISSESWTQTFSSSPSCSLSHR